MFGRSPRHHCQNACFRARRSQHKNWLVYLILHFSCIVGHRCEAKVIASLDPER
jgi:hypothetical protein